MTAKTKAQLAQELARTQEMLAQVVESIAPDIDDVESWLTQDCGMSHEEASDFLYPGLRTLRMELVLNVDTQKWLPEDVIIHLQEALDNTEVLDGPSAYVTSMVVEDDLYDEYDLEEAAANYTLPQWKKARNR